MNPVRPYIYLPVELPKSLNPALKPEDKNNAEAVINDCLSSPTPNLSTQKLEHLIRFFEAMGQDCLWMFKHAESAKEVIRAINLIYLNNSDNNMIGRIHQVSKSCFESLTHYAPKDAYFVVGQQEVSVNSLLLAVRFPYFDTFFRSQFKEAREFVSSYPKKDTDPCPKFSVNGALPKAVRETFELLHHGRDSELFKLSIVELEQVIEYADFIGTQPEILKTMQKFMIRMLSFDLAVKWLPFALKYNLTDLLKACETQIEGHLKASQDVCRDIASLEKELPDRLGDMFKKMETFLCRKVDQNSAQPLYRTAVKYKLERLRESSLQMVVYDPRNPVRLTFDQEKEGIKSGRVVGLEWMDTQDVQQVCLHSLACKVVDSFEVLKHQWNPETRVYNSLGAKFANLKGQMLDKTASQKREEAIAIIDAFASAAKLCKKIEGVPLHRLNVKELEWFLRLLPKNMTSIDLSGCLLTNLWIFDEFKLLRKVTLKDCSNLKNITGLWISTSIEELDISGCKNLYDIPFGRYKELRVLNLSGCKDIDYEKFNSLKLCQKLETLYIDKDRKDLLSIFSRLEMTNVKIIQV